MILTDRSDGWLELRVPSEMRDRVKEERERHFIRGEVVMIDEGGPYIKVRCEKKLAFAHMIMCFA